MESSADKLLVYLNRFGKHLAIGAVVLLISIIFPQRVKFHYEFQKGQRWHYETLYAPYDFPIKKSPQQIAEDRSRLIAGFIPYYRLHPEVVQQQLQEFEHAYKIWYQSLHTDTVLTADSAYVKGQQLGTSLIEAIYQVGVVEVDPAHQAKPADFVINVVHGNTIQPRILNNLYTPDEAFAAAMVRYDSLAEKGLSLPGRSLFEGIFRPNITFDAELSQKLLDQALSELVTTKGVVRKGDVIVTKGAVITESIYEVLVSFREKFESEFGPASGAFWVYVGYLILTALVFIAFLMYVRAYRREIMQQWSYLISVLMWPLIFTYLTFLVERSNAVHVFLLPYCIVPIVMRHFFSYRLAFFVHVVVVLLCSLLTSAGYQFTFLQIVAGVVAVLAVADARYWGRFFKSVLYITITYMVGFLATELVEEGSLRGVDWQMGGWIVGNSVLILLAFPLIPLMERTFGFVSAISLVEYSDVNKPLLKMLAIKAPGTFQHSIQVGHLAEAAASEIGADSLLVRVGALYHDIGKALHPEYFVENQQHYNPHERLDPRESARIIIKHVTSGANLAREYGLPQVIIDFILTHHGTTRVEYFYRNYCKEHPNEEVDLSIFTYPGPKPSTKEQGILMLADSIEATLRAYKTPTEEDIERVVDETLDSKIKDGQFEHCKLTFAELEICRKVFKNRLKSIYHPRIPYPEPVKSGN